MSNEYPKPSGDCITDRMRQRKAESQRQAPSAATVEGLVVRLASFGLLPYAHNLSIWQHVDDPGWGVCIESPYKHIDLVAHGDTLIEALREMMKLCNRGADDAQTKMPYAED